MFGVTTVRYMDMPSEIAGRDSIMNNMDFFI